MKDSTKGEEVRESELYVLQSEFAACEAFAIWRPILLHGQDFLQSSYEYTHSRTHIYDEEKSLASSSIGHKSG